MIRIADDSQSNGWHLAQINIGRIRAPLDDPAMAGFTDNLTRINQLGAEQVGFVWQLLTDEGDSTGFHVFDDPDMLINMTVWESIEALHAFTYRSEHAQFFRQRKDWFEPMEGPSLVLWWIPAGYHPTPEEAKERLALLADRGPTPLAFTFVKQFSIEEMLAYAHDKES